MDNQLIFWYPYIRAHDKALILTTADTIVVFFEHVGLLMSWGLMCGSSDGVTQCSSHAA